MKEFIYISVAVISVSFGLMLGWNAWVSRNDVKLASADLEIISEYPFRGVVIVSDGTANYEVKLQHGDNYQYAGGFFMPGEVHLTQDSVICRPF